MRTLLLFPITTKEWSRRAFSAKSCRWPMRACRCSSIPRFETSRTISPASLITPNHHEALRMTNLEEDSDDGLHQAARMIRQKLGCDAVLVTRGDRGIMLLEGDNEPVFVETTAREVYDVTGAGDTVIATLAAALSAGATMLEAATSRIMLRELWWAKSALPLPALTNYWRRL